MSKNTELISSTAHASHLAYGFESVRKPGFNNYRIVDEAQKLRKYSIPSNMDYLEDMYDPETGTSATAFRNKDTGEIILAYTGTNFQSEFLKDGAVDVTEVVTAGEEHYKPAFEFYERVRAKYGNNIVLTGHSLGGNIAQRVALEYNVQKTVVYNSAPLYVFEVSELHKFGTLDPMQVERAVKEQERIEELEKNYTGETIRIRSESDPVSGVGGKNLGIEYTLINGGGHPMVTIVESEVAMEEIEKLTKHMVGNNVNIDINNDGVVDIELKKINLGVRNLLDSNSNAVGAHGRRIQLNPVILRTLSNNLKGRIWELLRYIGDINSICTEKNKIKRFNFDSRKEMVATSVFNEIKNTKMPLILDNLSDSIGKVIEGRSRFEKLGVAYILITNEISSREELWVDGVKLDESKYNKQMDEFLTEVRSIVGLCKSEGLEYPSIYFPGRSVVIDAWRLVEENTKKMLKETERFFEGEGLRSGKEDGISQALETVLNVANANIEELKKTVLNVAELCSGLADNFEGIDQWLGGKLKNGDYIGVYTEKELANNYKEYLQRDGIFDDVKGVLQAFDRQVERRSYEYTKRMGEIYNESFSNLTNGLANWYRIGKFIKKTANVIGENFEKNIVIVKPEKPEERGYWGKMYKLYHNDIIESVDYVNREFYPAVNRIEQTIETINSTKKNMEKLVPAIKKIVENGIYKAYDLNGIIDSQRTVALMLDKINQEFNYVINHIDSEGMSGQAITALQNKMRKVMKSIEYYNTFISDCFGDQTWFSETKDWF
ncbi:SA1320 family protein [Gemella sanguinis]|uniref:DUF2974 domain-containing protein n=1 Tax=Gemella sanguinis TaxID=84135 RepID=A0A2N6SEV2_9BACL|nr:DUF2974 domain-containing protein [Gemella sanguinis]PMC52474.1 hypothetical protein CJ218_04950 [Gemella sanguinis]